MIKHTPNPDHLLKAVLNGSSGESSALGSLCRSSSCTHILHAWGRLLEGLQPANTTSRESLRLQPLERFLKGTEKSHGIHITECSSPGVCYPYITPMDTPSCSMVASNHFSSISSHRTLNSLTSLLFCSKFAQIFPRCGWPRPGLRPPRGQGNWRRGPRSLHRGVPGGIWNLTMNLFICRRLPSPHLGGEDLLVELVGSHLAYQDDVCFHICMGHVVHLCQLHLVPPRFCVPVGA